MDHLFCLKAHVVIHIRQSGQGALGYIDVFIEHLKTSSESPISSKSSSSSFSAFCLVDSRDSCIWRYSAKRDSRSSASVWACCLWDASNSDSRLISSAFWESSNRADFKACR